MLNSPFPMKIPAFQFYPADWRKDPSVQALSYHERGVWFEILCIMHESSERGKLLLNGKPMPLEVLSRLLGLDKQGLSRSLDVILEMGVAKKDEKGVIFSKRMVKDEETRRIRHEAGLKGGNPALLKQKVKTQVNGVVQQSNNQTSEDEVEDEDSVGESEGKSDPNPPPESPILIYEAYPRKVGRPVALKAIEKAISKTGFSALLGRTRAYAHAVKGTDTMIPNPATWFNQERYNDDPATWVRAGARPTQAFVPPAPVLKTFKADEKFLASYPKGASND